MDSKKTKEVNIKAFNMIRNRNEVKAMAEHISCNWIKLNKKASQHVCKDDRKCNKQIIVGTLAHIFVRIVSI